MNRQLSQGRPWRAALLLLLLVVVLPAAACRPPQTPLAHTFDSPDALAREVLDRLARRDQAGLLALALSHDEFETHVWPRLPASRPERNTPLSFVWGRLKQQSDMSLAGTVARHGGTRHELQQVVFDGEVTDYGTYTVHRESALVVGMPDGTTDRIRVFGSVIEQGGRYKVFSYVVD